MSKYLLLKHYRGGPAPVVDIDPMDRWTPAEVEAHITFMRDFADRLKDTGEYVDDQALSPEGTFVRYGGEGRPPVTDGPFPETKDLIAGWLITDVNTYDRALETQPARLLKSGIGAVTRTAAKPYIPCMVGTDPFSAGAGAAVHVVGVVAPPVLAGCDHARATALFCPVAARSCGALAR